jgi:hypothetical protein
MITLIEVGSGFGKRVLLRNKNLLSKLSLHSSPFILPLHLATTHSLKILSSQVFLGTCWKQIEHGSSNSPNGGYTKDIDMVFT